MAIMHTLSSNHSMAVGLLCIVSTPACAKGTRRKVSQDFDKGDYSKVRRAHRWLAPTVTAIVDVGDCLSQERAVLSNASSDSTPD